MCTASFVNCMNQFNYFVVSWSIYQSDHKSQMLVAFSSFPPPPPPFPAFPIKWYQLVRTPKLRFFATPTYFIHTWQKHRQLFGQKFISNQRQSGTFKCARSRCKTCSFIHNVEKISGPKRSIKIADHLTCTSANVIYCITCNYCNKSYIGETRRRLGDRFREHLRDVERNDKDASKPVARYFNLPNHSKQHRAVCGISLHLGSSESRKTPEQKFIFQIGTLNPHGINKRFSFK